MSEIPRSVRELAARREMARKARDFVTADALRARIRRAGFVVVDTPGGPELTRAPVSGEELGGPVAIVRSSEVQSLLDAPPRFDASIQWVVQGWPDDVLRGIGSFRRHCGAAAVQLVVVDMTGYPAIRWPEDVDVLRVAHTEGWAAARNAGLLRSAGGIVVLVDGSVEVSGDALGPLAQALADPAVGLTGPFGLVTQDLRNFWETEGPQCDAVEAYLMALRRELVQEGLRFDPKFTFYRSADIEFSFQVKARGLQTTVTRIPVVRHEHRIWTGTPEKERARLSKRNFYRFLDRWRGRTDLLAAKAPDVSISRGERESPGAAGSSMGQKR